MSPCVLCGEPCETDQRNDTKDRWYDCPTCKKFAVTEEANDSLELEYANKKWCLSIASAQAKPPGQRLEIDTANLDRLIQAYQDISYSTKRSTFLQFMKENSPHIGATVHLDARRRWAQLKARSVAEVGGILEGLQAEGLAELAGGGPGEPIGFRLTPKAWIALEPISNATGIGAFDHPAWPTSIV